MSSPINPPFKRLRCDVRVNLFCGEMESASKNFIMDPEKPFTPPALPNYLIKEFAQLLNIKDLLSLSLVSRQFNAFVFGSCQIYTCISAHGCPQLLEDTESNKISAFSALNELDLSHSRKRGPERQVALSIGKITSLANLHTLVLNSNLVDANTLNPLASLTKLKSLHLKDLVGIDKGFDAVLKLTQLKELDISRAVLATEQIERISQLTELTFLGIPRLRKKMPMNQKTYVESFAFLTSLVNLEVLDLSLNFKLGSRAIPSLKALTNLTILKISGSEIGDGVRKLDIPPSLEVLEAFDVGISEEMQTFLNRNNTYVMFS